jgi:hypothetical protein
MAATVEDPFSFCVHQTSPMSKPKPAHATCKYARTLSGSMLTAHEKLFQRNKFESRVAPSGMMRADAARKEKRDHSKRRRNVVFDAEVLLEAKNGFSFG